ncbi:NAD-dependent epimerase/dehydratase family protein [Candidatus Margulisiibacteriota bacterium]
MITGGLGMIGSTIAHKLVKHGANVTIVDACIEPYGANVFNINEIKDQVQVITADIRDKEAVKSLVKDKDIIFNLAAQVSHNDSMADPFLDADINYLGHLNVLENIRLHNPKAMILHAGSRLQYGQIKSVPVNENHDLRPRTPYALNKTAAENMYLFYHEMHNIPCSLFRIANPYGPRSQMKHNKYSMVNWFIRQAMENKLIKVFGDGKQIRDYIYVDDLADAFLLAAVEPKCCGKVFNIGSGKGTKFIDMAELIVRTVGSGKTESVPWPDDYVRVETGDYITNINAFSEATGWKPKTSLESGIKSTNEYYRKNRSFYW